jgi:ribonuclease HI
MSNNLIYTDGACSKNGSTKATGGYGIYLKHSCFGEELKINCKGEPMQMQLNGSTETFYVTNIRMEGLAIIATMFLYAERFVFNQNITDPVAFMNEKFLKQEKPLKLSYGTNELNVHGSDQCQTFEIVTDSLFWMNVIQSWMPTWARKGILMQKKNPDLLLLLHYYSTLFEQNKVKVVLTHVRSHQRGKRTAHADGNDVADVLATSSAGNSTTEFMLN